MAERTSWMGRACVAAGIIALSITILGVSTSSAQLGLFPTPRPTPRPTAPPTPAPQPTPNPQPTSGPPQATPQPSNQPFPGPSDDPGLPDPFGGPQTPLPNRPTKSHAPEKTGDPLTPLKPGQTPGADAKLPEEFDVPSIPRTPGHNTVRLVELLEPLTQAGVSLTDALVQGMGRFPVAGIAWYTDDWLNPRYTPKFHLHHGLDIFADFGTPIRSPEEGVVTRMTQGPTGGIGVWVRGRSGVSYYFAHLQRWAENLKVGQRTEVGTVIGYVGDTGNARGGAPHLHFEVHDPGAIPPKPFVDAWLAEAERLAPQWVRYRTQDITLKRELLRTDRPSVSFDAVTSTDVETSMLLTLLDPVGGSVGLLPKLKLQPARVPPVSERLVQELVRLRVGGQMFGRDVLPAAFGSTAS